MNLQENISRIRQMMGLLTEEELPSGFDSLKDISNRFDEKVEKLQKFLKSKGYDLGEFGPDDDGIDGKYGPVTKKAHKKYLEDEKIIDPKTGDEKEDDKSEDSGVDIILMGGLDYRSGDLEIPEQVEMLKKNNPNKKIVGHRYNEPSKVEKSISENPNATLVLFSAGCSYASKFASLIKNKDRLFIVEPYASSEKTKNSVKDAVSKGVPSSNVVVGPNKDRGKDVVDGAKKTPSGVSHWGSLKYVSELV